MTAWLIHFVHRKSVSELPKNLPKEIENSVYHFSSDISDQDEFRSLFSIVSECGIRYGYSFRKERTTIYGGSPVVCFSEMPFDSYFAYIKDRNNVSAVGNYGVAITKQDAFALGARPVIYGLSIENEFQLSENLPYRRVLAENVLPVSEQYRFVPLELGTDRRSDWTHEREWRLKHSKRPGDFLVCEDQELDLLEIPGVDIFNLERVRHPVVLIVRTAEDAARIQEKVQLLIDAEENDFGIPFTSSKIRILVVDKYLADFSEIARIEDLPNDCYFTIPKKTISDVQLKGLSDTIRQCKEIVAPRAAAEFLNQRGLKPDKDGWVDCGGLCGFGKVVAYTPNSQIIRGLVKLGIAKSYGNYYVIDAVGYDFPKSQSVDYNEHIAKAVSEFLNEHLSTKLFYYHGVLD